MKNMMMMMMMKMLFFVDEAISGARLPNPIRVHGSDDNVPQPWCARGMQVWSNAGLGTPQNTHQDIIQNGCQVGVQMHYGATCAWSEAI